MQRLYDGLANIGYCLFAARTGGILALPVKKIVHCAAFGTPDPKQFIATAAGACVVLPYCIGQTI